MLQSGSMHYTLHSVPDGLLGDTSSRPRVPSSAQQCGENPQLTWNLTVTSPAQRTQDTPVAVPTETSTPPASPQPPAPNTAQRPSPQPQGQPTVIPALLLGDLFAPCNAIGLFQNHEDLDQLMGRLGRSQSDHTPNPSSSRTHRRRHHGSSKEPADSMPAGNKPEDPAPQAQQRESHSQQPPVPSTFEQGVANLGQAPLQGRPSSKHGHVVGTKLPRHRRHPGAAGQGPGSAGGGTLAVNLDPSVQLLVRTVSCVNDKRLFFVSPRAADVIREGLVLKRHRTLQEQKQAEQRIHSPLSTLPGNGAQLGNISAWLSSTMDWLQPRQLHAGHATEGPASPVPGSAVGGAPAQHSAAGQDTRPVPRSVAALGRSDATGGPLGAHQVIPLVTQLVDAATQLGPAFDWRALEEKCVAAEAAHIRSGKPGRPVMTEGPASFVGRVPLQAAFSLVSSAPDKFKCIVRGVDHHLVQEAHGRPALLDLARSKHDRWVLKVEESGPESEPGAEEEACGAGGGLGQPVESSHGQGAGRTGETSTRGHGRLWTLVQHGGSDLSEESDSDADEEMALITRTPMFQIPGIHLTLRTSGGQRVLLTPTFLSISQLHEFLEAGKSVARCFWLQSRRQQRLALTRRLEQAALALSGLGPSSAFPGFSGPMIPPSGGGGGGGQEEEDDDENGFGELPEAKVLLAELGERSSRPSASGVVGPVTGWHAFVSTLAVGVVSAVGHVGAAVGNAWDQVRAQGPFGERGALTAMGMPTQLAVAPDYLEPCLQSLAVENASHMEAWQAARRRQGVLARAASLPTLPPLSLGAQGKGNEEDKTQAQGHVAAPGADGHVSSAPPSGTDNQQQQPSAGTAPDLRGSEQQAAAPAWPDNGADQGDASGPLAPEVASEGGSKQSGLPGAQTSDGTSAKQSSAKQRRGAASAAGAAQQLESMPGVSMLLQAAWAVLQDAHVGDGLLTGALAAGWSSQVQSLSSEDGEVSLVMTVRLRSQLADAITTTGSQDSATAQGASAGPAAASANANTNAPAAAQTAPAASGAGKGGEEGASAAAGMAGNRLVAASGAGRSLSALMALSVPPHLAAQAQTHKFEVGLHVNTKKLFGEVSASAVDSVSKDKTSLRGLLLVGDLGLSGEEPVPSMAGAVMPLYRAPSLGYMDLAQLLAAHQLQQAMRHQAPNDKQ